MFYGMLSPSSSLPKVNWLTMIPYYDKIVHASMFFGFSFLLFCLLEFENSLKRIIISIFFLSIGFGLFTEGLQYLLKNLTHRSFEYMDFCADTIGVIIALVIGYCIARYKEK
jgi:VanZ like family.